MSHLGKLLERVDELTNDPCFKDVRINFEDFKNFAELRKKLLPLSLALFCLPEMIFSEQNHMYGVYLHFYASHNMFKGLTTLGGVKRNSLIFGTFIQSIS
jgi:hypothetical protein